MKWFISFIVIMLSLSTMSARETRETIPGTSIGISDRFATALSKNNVDLKNHIIAGGYIRFPFTIRTGVHTVLFTKYQSEKHTSTVDGETMYTEKTDHQLTDFGPIIFSLSALFDLPDRYKMEPKIVYQLPIISTQIRDRYTITSIISLYDRFYRFFTLKDMDVQMNITPFVSSMFAKNQYGVFPNKRADVGNYRISFGNKFHLHFSNQGFTFSVYLNNLYNIHYFNNTTYEDKISGYDTHASFDTFWGVGFGYETHGFHAEISYGKETRYLDHDLYGNDIFTSIEDPKKQLYLTVGYRYNITSDNSQENLN